jgi:hypothetical protein
MPQYLFAHEPQDVMTQHTYSHKTEQTIWEGEKKGAEANSNTFHNLHSITSYSDNMI